MCLFIRWKKNGVVTKLEDIEVTDKLKYIAQQIIHNGKLINAEGYNEKVLGISARQIIPTIANGPGEWEQSLRPEVAELIKKNKLLGYQE